MKKILSLTLSLTMVLMLNIPVQSEQFVQTYVATVDFDDFVPDLIHDEPRVEEVISCNMVLKPETQAHLSRFCDSAVGNVMYYFNEEDDNVQKGPDYDVVDNGEEYILFYPATRQISNSYIGGTISYKASCDFHTKNTSGDIIHMEVPGEYQTADIISSKTLFLDMGEEYTLYQPTGDQSQPDWVGVKEAVPELSGIMAPCVFRFGSIPDSGVNGAFGLSKVKMENFEIIAGVCYQYPSLTLEQAALASSWTIIDDVVYMNQIQESSLNDTKMEICNKATKFIMQYNLNPEACNDNNEVLSEDGWADIDENYASQVTVRDGKLCYPKLANAWGRIIAVVKVDEPESVDYRPAKRVRVKSRISSYGGFKFNNLQEGDVVKIYNVSGKKVAELNSDFEWLGKEGTNNSGDWVKSGIYIYQIKLKDKSKIISGTISFVW